jgi:hypothetical protein
MKKALFNITVYSMLGWSIISFGYFALPPEIQALIPQFNWVSSLISGSSTALLGFGGVAVQQYIARAQTKAAEKYTLLAENFISLESKYQTVADTNIALQLSNQRLERKVDRMTNLVEADVRAKLSNPLIDSEIKKLIESKLNEGGLGE